jgi:hypothetical protein
MPLDLYTLIQVKMATASQGSGFLEWLNNEILKSKRSLLGEGEDEREA